MREAAAVLREWAASHPNAEYDARVTAYDESKARAEAPHRQRAEQWLAEHPKAVAIYEALSEDDRFMVRLRTNHNSLARTPTILVAEPPELGDRGSRTHRGHYV